MAKTHLLKYLRETFFGFWRKSSAPALEMSLPKSKFESQRELIEWSRYFDNVLDATNIYHYELTRADGTIEMGVLPVDSENYKARKKALEQFGNLTFPLKNTITICDESTGEKFIFDPNVTSSQKPERLVLLKGVHAPNNIPQAGNINDLHNDAGLDLIRHLESIRRDFHPNFHPPLAGHIININMRIENTREGCSIFYTTGSELVSEKENPLVFEEQFLTNFYFAFNKYLWEDTDLATCLNWFRAIPVGKPVFKKGMTFYFCYAVGKIETRMIKEQIPNVLNDWIKPVINGNNYSSLKKRANDKEKIAEINKRLPLL